VGRRSRKRRGVKAAWLCLPLIPVAFLLLLDWDLICARIDAFREQPIVFSMPPISSLTDSAQSAPIAEKLSTSGAESGSNIPVPRPPLVALDAKDILPSGHTPLMDILSQSRDEPSTDPAPTPD
jgi:hypothetical protein